jgi:hypothetical protein
MAKQLAFLEYTFVFEPGAQTWQRGFEFEKDLADFLAAHGLDASITETIGGTGRRVIFIEGMDKMADLLNPIPNPPGRPKSVSSQLKEYATSKPRAAERNFNKGKFLVRKGYLKREI